jgi:two-component system, NarL family, nitrate/nitrite response regulator NarL
MRVVLVGSARERALLREGMREPMTVVGEYATLADARAAGSEADAIVMADRGLRHANSSGAMNPATALREPQYEEPLTPREVQVLELLAEGLPNKAIAARLGISDQTVKFHVAAISGKLGAANRTDAVRLAVRRGLITL